MSCIASISKQLIVLFASLALLTACGGGGGDKSITAKLTSNGVIPLGGLHYLISKDGDAVSSGETDADGSFNYHGGDEVTFFLDSSEAIPLSEVALSAASSPTIVFFDHLISSTDSDWDPELFREKLVRLLVALDASPSRVGVQMPERVIEAATLAATDLQAALSQHTSIGHFVNTPGVQALLAAMDDPATPVSEAKSALPSYLDASAALGLAFTFPYETVDGDVCYQSEPTPGCTFSTSNGTRITVVKDPDYDKYGYGSDDLWYVKFDGSGNASVYNDLGQFQYSANVADFAGYIGGTTIGVGTSGTYWENVSNGTYWLGKNGVLYNANSGESKYGQAIN